MPPAGALMRRRSACIVMRINLLFVLAFVKQVDVGSRVNDRRHLTVHGGVGAAITRPFQAATLNVQQHPLPSGTIGTAFTSSSDKPRRTFPSAHALAQLSTMCGSDILLGLIAILFPPLAVWVKRGLCSADSLINILLCCMFHTSNFCYFEYCTDVLPGLAYLPGLLHAWYIIAITPDPTYERVAQQDAERGTVTYYYVQTNGQPHYAPQGHGGQSYGTVNASAPNAQFAQQQTKPQPHPGAAAVHPSSSQAGPSGEEDAPPPSYQQATGDNKIQRP